MHDMLLEHQKALVFHDLVRYAGLIGLDIPLFERDVESHTYADRIIEDMMSGARSGVNGTPTFFINGRRHVGAFDEETLLTALLAARRPKGAGHAKTRQRAA
jgi:predicted DsbA family dithiol-disulfide isomerase